MNPTSRSPPDHALPFASQNRAVLFCDEHALVMNFHVDHVVQPVSLRETDGRTASLDKNNFTHAGEHRQFQTHRTTGLDAAVNVLGFNRASVEVVEGQ